MNSLEAMYGCGLNFFIKLAYNSLFLYKFATVIIKHNNEEISQILFMHTIGMRLAFNTY